MLQVNDSSAGATAGEDAAARAIARAVAALEAAVPTIDPAPARLSAAELAALQEVDALAWRAVAGLLNAARPPGAPAVVGRPDYVPIVEDGVYWLAADSWGMVYYPSGPIWAVWLAPCGGVGYGLRRDGRRMTVRGGAPSLGWPAGTDAADGTGREDASSPD